MDEQRNRGRAAVPVFLGDRCGAANGWSIHALRPLLTELGGASFSKEFSKGFSKGGPAIRFRTARGALLDGFSAGVTPEYADWAQVLAHQGVAPTPVACWLLADYMTNRRTAR